MLTLISVWIGVLGCVWGVCSHQVLVLFMGCFALIIGLYFRLYSYSPRLLVLALLQLSTLMQWIALDRVSYRRSVWVIHLWMTRLSWYLSHLRVVFIALWLVAAAIIVDCLLWMQDWSSRSWTFFSIVSLSVLTTLFRKLISLFPSAAIVLVEVFALWWLPNCSG